MNKSLLSWYNYCIGDVVHCRTKQKFHLDIYPNSLASKYIKNSMMRKDDYNLINELINNVEEYKNINGGLDNEIVIHLRTGDTINIKNTKSNYSYSFDYYEKLSETLSKQYKYKNKKIILVSGIHLLLYDCKSYADIKNALYLENHTSNEISDEKLNNKFYTNFKYSTEYINKIKNIFEKYFIVEIKLSGNPDYDLIYMSKSKFFIHSGGWYSDLCKNMCILRGNTVINNDIKRFDKM